MFQENNSESSLPFSLKRKSSDVSMYSDKDSIVVQNDNFNYQNDLMSNKDQQVIYRKTFFNKRRRDQGSLGLSAGKLFKKPKVVSDSSKMDVDENSNFKFNLRKRNPVCYK